MDEVDRILEKIKKNTEKKDVLSTKRGNGRKSLQE